MQKLLAASALALLVSSPAVAQDWDRWFVGFDAGYIWRSATTIADGQVDRSGFAAGTTIGRWWSHDQILLGFDAGLSFGGAYWRDHYPAIGLSSGWDSQQQETIAASVRLKAGVPVGKFLPYVAAGPQYIHESSSFKWWWNGSPSQETTRTTVHFGALLSAGVEVPVSDALTVKAEYGLNVRLPPSNETTSFSGWSGKVGINYYFD